MTIASDLEFLLHDAFGLSSFRPHQEEVCSAVASGESALLVMPTGAGKSLCFQLPGLARRRTSSGIGSGRATLVIAPLIALMTEQVAKLQKLGLNAETINSNMTQEDQRAVARMYNDGTLDYLFISPERLAQPRVPEWLGRRAPALIAIDEAHCISHWGHDFRPEYRMLEKRLPLVRGGQEVPIVAVTATATPMVQDDILEKLGMKHARHKKFVHGFRRTNLGIEIVDVAPAARIEAAAALIGDESRRPAIIYVRSRALAEEAAFELRSLGFKAKPFHAGLSPTIKKSTQAEFSADAIDVVVATIAFGMGVDKPNVRTVIHTSIPESVESYYQEIGRAGRDGAPSGVFLFYSQSDEKLHDWFFKKSYPETSVLAEVWNAIGKEPERVDGVAARVESGSVTTDVIAEAIDKLRVHDGAVVDGFESDRWIHRGTGNWRVTYEAQKRKKKRDLEDMAEFASMSPSAPRASKNDCRMTRLVRYFGDQGDPGVPCGQCDMCLAARGLEGVSKSSGVSKPRVDEVELADQIVQELTQRKSQGTGQLFRVLFPGTEQSRDQRDFFDHVLGTMKRSGVVDVREMSFPKDGERIFYERVSLTAKR